MPRLEQVGDGKTVYFDILYDSQSIVDQGVRLGRGYSRVVQAYKITQVKNGFVWWWRTKKTWRRGYHCRTLDEAKRVIGWHHRYKFYK